MRGGGEGLSNIVKTGKRPGEIKSGGIPRNQSPVTG